MKYFQKYLSGSFFLNFPLVINTLIAVATLPIILASLPISDYGKFQFALALQYWLVALSAENITVASKRGIAKGLDGTFIYAFLSRLKLIAVFSALVLGISLYLNIIGEHIFSVLTAIIAIYMVFGYLLQASFREFLIAKKRFRGWCLWQISIASISMVSSTFVAFLTKDVISFAIVQLGSISALSSIAWISIVKKECLIGSYKTGKIDKACVPYGLKLIPLDLVSATSAKISSFIIGPFFGFANLAIFSVAHRLRDRCAFIIKSVRQLLYADFALLERNQFSKILNPHLIKLGALGSFLTLIFILLGWLYTVLLLPSTYHLTFYYFAILVLGLPPGILSMVLHTFLESHLRYRQLILIGTINNSIKILLILAFGYLWQILGICIALSASVWVSFGLYYLLTLRKDLLNVALESSPILAKISKRLKPA